LHGKLNFECLIAFEKLRDVPSRGVEKVESVRLLEDHG
jgi:hypothetical protein